MGQYYNPILLDRKEYLYSHDYNNGLKLMEHSYIGNNFVNTVMNLIEKPEHLVWAGDYANNEELSSEYYQDKERNTLYSLCDEEFTVIKPIFDFKDYKYIINHDKKEFVTLPIQNIDDEEYIIHPLPLLTCEGNGRGGGDFYNKDNKYDDYIGRWARNLISSSNEDNDILGLNEIKPNFNE